MIRNCSICGSEVITKYKLAFHDLLGADSSEYVQHIGLCRNCGYIFTQNPFTPEQLENRYKNMSKFEYDSTSYVLTNDYRRQCSRQKHFLEDNLDFTEINSILEVGAASGYNLSLYKDTCVNVTGIEPSALNCTLCREKYGIRMFCGMFSDYLRGGNKDTFDLVFLSMVLEHIVDPMAFLSECSELCNQYMFIEIPTLDIRCAEEPMGIFAEEHVSLFTLDSLHEMMKRLGYRLVCAENVYGLGSYLPAGYPAIESIWKKAEKPLSYPRYNMFTAEECLDKYIAESEKGLAALRQKIDRIPDTEDLAVWGVGHHASMLLANTSLGKKNIVRVYDSDERKRGMLFAGIKMGPFDRSDVENGVINAILITTYTAQKAIEKAIAGMNLDCKIYKLYDL